MKIAQANRNRIISFITPRGEQVYTTAQTNTDWVVPIGISTVTVFAVQGGQGGGGAYGGSGGDSAYVISLSVTEGETLTVTVGAGGGPNSSTSASAGNAGAHSLIRRAGSIIFSSDGTGASNNQFGGSGGSPFTCSSPYGSGYNGGGGGGAAGYTGNGGNANGGNGAGGGGGAGTYDSCSPVYSSTGDYYFFDDGQGGGGTGLFGEGASGTINGGGGSGGTNGSFTAAGIPGGGGGGGYERVLPGGVTDSYSIGDAGGVGGLRIVWGDGRAFPSTDVALTV